MRVLVIGGTGNISSAIVQRLLNEGHNVTCFNRGQRPVRYQGDVTVIHGDKKDYAAFEAAMQPLSFDAVIDMISYTKEDAASTLRAFEGRVGHIVVTSSVAAYKRPIYTVPVPDNTPLTDDNSFPYGYEKARMELFLRERMALGSPITIIRPSLTYGVGCANIGVLRQNYGLVTRIRAGKPLVVFGDGTNPWTYTFAPDLAKAYVGALMNPNCFGKHYHACSDDGHIWDDLYLAFGRIIGVEPNIVHLTTEQLCALSNDVFSHIDVEKKFCGAYDTRRIKRDVPSFTIDYTLDKTARAIYDWWESDEAARQVNPALDALEDQAVALHAKWLAEARAAQA